MNKKHTVKIIFFYFEILYLYRILCFISLDILLISHNILVSHLTCSIKSTKEEYCFFVPKYYVSLFLEKNFQKNINY